MRIYGHLDANFHLAVWNLIYSMGNNMNKPWIVFGEFNEVLHLFKKYGVELV